ncbi:MAG: hypothetical protein ACRDFS_03985 [Chloroflexota bacterium]
MRRAAVVVVLLVLIALVSEGRGIASRAAPATGAGTATATVVPTVQVFGNFCFGGPYHQLVACPTPIGGTSRSLILPTKTLDVGSAIPAPDGTTTYPVTLTSRLACFSQGEPIQLSVLGSPNASALTQLFPLPAPSSSDATLITSVDRVTGSANLSLEVFDKAVNSQGVALKAYWPQEQVEHIDVVVAPKLTPTATPTATSTNTAVATGTPAPTTAATQTPTSTPVTFTVQACVDPAVAAGHTLGGQTATVYGRTLPGAACTASVQYRPTYGSPSDFDGSSQLALADGLVLYPFTEDSTGTFGLATVSCVPPGGGAAKMACTAFQIAQTGTQDLLTQDVRTSRLQNQALAEKYCPAGSAG